MPPYSHSVDLTDDVTTPAPGTAKKLNILHHSKSSSSCCETDDPPPRNINRWAQLRQLLFTLIGRSIQYRPDESPRMPLGRRTRSRSPILLLHHDFWLEAIDKKHRYGFHLRAFHEAWKDEMQDVTLLRDNRNRSFFYWLDHGRGRDLELPNCGRDALNATRVQYCSSQQRQQFEVEFTTSRIAFTESREPVQTDGDSKWIFVLSQDNKLYIARKIKGFFHHSSFLAGVPVVAAGKIYVSNGKINAIEPHSGHFKPKLDSLLALCSVLQAHAVDPHNVHFIKPRKWKDPWPFEEVSIRNDEYVSDSEDS